MPKNTLTRFEGPEYKDYEYGNPQNAARRLTNVVYNLKVAIETAELECGDALWPGMKAALQNDLMEMLEKLN